MSEEKEASSRATSSAAAPAPEDPSAPRAKPLPRRLPVAPPSTLIPARMVNEVLYCERLMYLERVQDEWADNAYTADGKGVHRRVNEQEKALPEATEEASDRPYVARSVWLSSESLGLTAKLDLVELEGGMAVPVEYKRSAKPDLPEGAYLPERAQLCAQVLLLREHGYSCEHGEIYYAKDRARVPITIDEALIAQTLWAVDRVRALEQGGTLPPPLEDSPKCHGCSLVGICLPDETNALSDEPEPSPAPPDRDDDALDVGDDPWGLAPAPEHRVRRLFPARDDKVPVYVQAQGANLRLDGERLIVNQKGQAAKETRLSNTSHVALFGNVHVTTPAIRKMLDRGIPLLFFSWGGWFTGQAVGHDSKNVQLRLAQYAATQDVWRCLTLARGFVASKILNCRTLLRRNDPEPDPTALFELKQLARKARATDSIESLLGIEGTAARRYFGEFTRMLKGFGEFDLDGRNRRPPRDPINALLSFCYALLTKELTLAVRSVGLDGMLGFYHQPHFGRPSLALDLMEEFRPVLADSTVINAINNGVIKPDDFVHAAGAVSLTAPARKRLILAFERRMDQLVTHPVFDYRISYRRILEVQARLLSRVLLGELSAYPEFRVR